MKRRKALASAVGLIVAAAALAVGTLVVAFLVALSGFGTNVSHDEEAIAILILGGAAVLAMLWRAGFVLHREYRRWWAWLVPLAAVGAPIAALVASI